MTSHSSEPEQEKIQQEKEYGDSATAVTPDTQQPAQGERVNNGDENGDGDGDDTGAQGADADTIPDDADAESGFYG
ncbi:hypothetical protein [Nocardioides panacisoli]|uniref:Uncharacterized protein n=1 Tax=Nocardioides panacisoli TaxID=627624 RepID=A0ABP7IZS0_9ACTN